jgi:hypothetical protein
MSFNAFGLKVLAQRSILAAAIGATLAWGRAPPRNNRES